MFFFFSFPRTHLSAKMSVNVKWTKINFITKLKAFAKNIDEQKNKMNQQQAPKSSFLDIKLVYLVLQT